MGTLRAVLDKTKLFFFFKLHILTLSSRLLETKPGVLKEMLRRFPAVFVAEEPDILSQKVIFCKKNSSGYLKPEKYKCGCQKRKAET